MEDINLKILERLDKLIEIQSSILNCLTKERKVDFTNIPKPPKEKSVIPPQEDIAYYLLCRNILKEKFNLVAAPQMHTCIQYKNTRDDRIFDRFKKKKNK